MNTLRHYRHLAILTVLGTQAFAAVPATQPDYGALPAPVVAAPPERIDSTYQWSIVIPTQGYEQRAYLWIPPKCQRVRGVVVGLQNMLEKLMFQNGDFRDACAASDLAILYIAPGSTTTDRTKEPPLWLQPKDMKAAIASLDDTLKKLADLSGYDEIAAAPLIPVAHSAATPFGYGLAYYATDRCIGFIPYKGWFSGVKGDLPILHVSSEYGEVGGENWGQTWANKDRVSILKLRAGKANPEMGELAEIGNGHFAWQPASGKILGLFLRKIVAARVPQAGGALQPLRIERGVLVTAADLGTPAFKAWPYKDYPDDKAGAYWYIDAEMAKACNDYMVPLIAKRPQAMDVYVKGKPAPLDKGGMAELGVVLEPDGVTWKVQPCYLDKAPPQLMYGESPLGHATTRVFFRVTSGAIKQTGTDTFRVWLGRGGVERQGNPWDPWAIAVQPGDDLYRSADRPVHFIVLIRRKDGTAQTIDFPKPADISANVVTVSLHAAASSNLPVQYFVVSGPAEVSDDGTSLKLLPIPPRAKLPIEVRVGAFQWGRGVDPKVASAEPVEQTFTITK
ncbi:MAG: hypothetical protein JWM57_3868 [Phycisphaerales bacterium]|nr:hypothetical protein [Phycisphaerales bacterium]